ncbi:MAG: hypothetical protein O3B13_09085 [Planctomycetota bacterium]|nr:hypothetical protein [Planctomycetota bacterium]
MQTFQEMAASRREWIADVLIPWSRQASFGDLREAEHDWINIAGRVDPAATLWTWAWSRFPCLVHERLPGVNETLEVRIVLTSGKTIVGYPDNRESARGQLILTVAAADGGFEQSGPHNIDAVVSAELSHPDQTAEREDIPDRPVTTLPPNIPDDQRV